MLNRRLHQTPLGSTGSAAGNTTGAGASSTSADRGAEHDSSEAVSGEVASKPGSASDGARSLPERMSGATSGATDAGVYDMEAETSEDLSDVVTLPDLVGMEWADGVENQSGVGASSGKNGDDPRGPGAAVGGKARKRRDVFGKKTGAMGVSKLGGRTDKAGSGSGVGVDDARSAGFGVWCGG